MTPRPPRHKPKRSLARTIAEPLIIAVVLAFAIRTFGTIYEVPSASMAPALLPGDRIVVTRFLTDGPERGDVIVFRHPISGSELVVKRVIALPGDLVDSHMGRVRIGGRTLDEPYASAGTTGSIPPQLVPADHLFVLGDNRAGSYDSRSWGPLPRHLVLGRARLILWHGRSTGRIFKWIR